MRAPVYDVVLPQLFVQQMAILLGACNLSFRRYLNDDLSSRLCSSKGDSLDDLPPGVFRAKLYLLA